MLHVMKVKTIQLKKAYDEAEEAFTSAVSVLQKECPHAEQLEYENYSSSYRRVFLCLLCGHQENYMQDGGVLGPFTTRITKRTKSHDEFIKIRDKIFGE